MGRREWRRVHREDSVGALADLEREGKIGHIGLSNVSAAELSRARKLVEIVSVQNHYNLRERPSDAVVDLCAAAGIAFIPWYPLAARQLARAWDATNCSSLFTRRPSNKVACRQKKATYESVANGSMPVFGQVAILTIAVNRRYASL
jgi:aryl-alcohol dehydrogenase-like predicted oxidoreductase